MALQRSNLYSSSFIVWGIIVFCWMVFLPFELPGAQAKREILVVYGIHQDIGFLDDYETMMHDYRKKMLGYLDLMESCPDLTLNWGNLYNLKDFLEYFPGQKHRIKRLIDQGRMVFPAQWVDYEPDWPPGEYMIRQCAHSVAYLKKEFGYRPTWCHLLDVPSLTPQYAQVLSKSGIKICLLHFNYHNPDYNRFFAPPGPAVEAETALRGGVYEYVGLDGTGIIGYMGKEHYSMLNVAFGWYRHEFGSFRATVDRFARHFTLAEKVAGLKLAHFDQDHGAPVERIPILRDSIKVWNRESPFADSARIRFGTVDELVRSFDARRSRMELPEFTGQTRPWVWSGRYWERGRYYLNKAISEVLSAEKFAAFGSMLGLSGYPEKDLEQVWEKLLWPADHNWLAGTNTDGFKAEAAYSAYLEADRLLDRELYKLAAAVNTLPGRRALVVFNPTNWSRSYPVSVKISTGARGFKVSDSRSGESQYAWPGAPRRAGRMIQFIARDVPSLGYKTYYLEELDQAVDTQPCGLAARGDTLENQYYRIVFDPAVGIRSIFDKKAGREIVKPNFMGLDGMFITDTAQVTPVFASRTLRYQDKRIIVRLYQDLEMVDFQITAEDKNFLLDMAGMFLPHEYADLASRAPQLLSSGPNVCRMEFALSDPVLTVGVPFGAVPYVPARTMEHFPMPLDFSRRSPKEGFVSYFQDFGGLPNAINILKWLDCYEPRGDYGVTLAYEQSQTEFVVAAPGILRLPLYIQHPLEHTVLRSPHNYHLVLRGHRGDWKKANSPALGWEVSQPLVARERLSAGNSSLPETGSFLDAENSSVVVSAVKKSYYGDSYIIHCAEMLDTDTRLELRPALLKPRSPERINLTEDERLPGAEVLADGGFSLELKGFAVEAVSFRARK